MKEKIHYGLDAPLVPIAFIIAGVGVLINWLTAHQYTTAWLTLGYALILIVGGLIFFHTSFRGKLIIWRKLLAKTSIQNNAAVLDLGCGHGAVLITVAKLLGPMGRAVGVDLWRNTDQAHNSMAETKRNLTIAKVTGNTELVTADMAELPFDDASFDMVTSSFAFHNIKPAQRRLRALNEAARVLKPGGRLIIVDTGHHRKQYVDFLRHKANVTDVQVTNAGFNGWWTGPWMASNIFEATKK